MQTKEKRQLRQQTIRKLLRDNSDIYEVEVVELVPFVDNNRDGYEAISSWFVENQDSRKVRKYPLNVIEEIYYKSGVSIEDHWLKNKIRRM